MTDFPMLWFSYTVFDINGTMMIRYMVRIPLSLKAWVIAF